MPDINAILQKFFPYLMMLVPFNIYLVLNRGISEHSSCVFKDHIVTVSGFYNPHTIQWHSVRDLHFFHTTSSHFREYKNVNTKTSGYSTDV